MAQIFAARSKAISLDFSTIEKGDYPETKGGHFVIEDVNPQTISQEPFLHFYNSLQGEGGTMLITAQTPPSKWNISLADLDSRLRALPALSLGLPEDQVLKGVLLKRFSDFQVRVGIDIINYITVRIDRSFAVAQEVVRKINICALERRRNVTLPLVREVLEEFTNQEQ